MYKHFGYNYHFYYLVNELRGAIFASSYINLASLDISLYAIVQNSTSSISNASY